MLQNGPPRTFYYFFSPPPPLPVLSCLLVILTNGPQCRASVRQQQWRNVHFSPEVFVVGNLCECLKLKKKTAPILFQAGSEIAAPASGSDLTRFPVSSAVEPPSDLKFKILNENSVEMSWRRPSSRIEGFRIQVVSDSGQRFRRQSAFKCACASGLSQPFSTVPFLQMRQLETSPLTLTPR